MFIRSVLAVILGIGALSACADDTRLHLEVDVDPALAIDSYELRVGDRRALAAPLAAIDVLVPDSMGGTTTNVELWGLHGGQQVAYGIAAVTPEAHGTVHVAVELVAVACGTWCQEGSVACGSEGGHDGTITCQQAADGCVGWSAVTACPSSAPYCSAGACAATCTDECTAGATECDSAFGMRACGQYDNDPCLDWSPVMACPSGQACTNGTCGVKTDCTNGSACDDGNGCTFDDTCSAGVCAGEPVVCSSPPANTCASTTTLQTYADAGTCTGSGTCNYTEATISCPTTCTSGECMMAIDAGFHAVCAITQLGTIACWGDLSVIGPPPSGTYTRLTTNISHACAITASAQITCWGSNAAGETNVPPGTYRAVSAGLEYTCALRTNGTLACWGIDDHGQATPPSGTYTAISAEEKHACALRSDGAIRCWGDNTDNQLVTPSGAFTALATNAYGGCALRSNGSVTCWGNQIAAPPTSLGFTAIFGGGSAHTCAIAADGTPRCWGNNSFHECDAPTGSFSTLSLDLGLSCGVRTNNSIVCWGRNDANQLAVPPELQ